MNFGEHNLHTIYTNVLIPPKEPTPPTPPPHYQVIQCQVDHMYPGEGKTLSLRANAGK